MKIICATGQGGCGQRFEVTDELLKLYRQCANKSESSSCPNLLCKRILSPDNLKALVHLIDKTERLTSFPLKKPIVPAGRRKNGARPGMQFPVPTGVVATPTPAEIDKIRRFFAAGLDDRIDCPCCTRSAQRQHRPLGCGPARWLVELVYLSGNGQAIHTGEVLKALKGNHISGSDATSVLPLYGLIEPAIDPNTTTNPPPPSSRGNAKGRTAGFWKATKLGRGFALNKIKVPARVVTCLGVPEAFEGDPVSIRDALGKKFNYDEIMGKKTRATVGLTVSAMKTPVRKSNR